jgi:hypothetical protein
MGPSVGIACELRDHSDEHENQQGEAARGTEQCVPTEYRLADRLVTLSRASIAALLALAVTF